MNAARGKKREKKSAKTVAPAPTGTFDDALPERLQTLGRPDAAKLPVYRATPDALSPYVIRLARGNEKPVLAQTGVPALESLAASLIIDGDSDDGAASDGLADDLPLQDAVRRQLSEHDIVLDIPVVDEPFAPEADVPEDFVLPFIAPTEALPLHDFFLTEPNAADLSLIPEVAEPPHETLAEEIAEIEALPVATTSWSLAAVFRLPHGWQRALAGFMGLAIVLVLPLQALQSIAEVRTDADALSAVGQSAIDEFTLAASAFANQNFDLAGDEFSRAAAKFAQAESQLADTHAAIAAVVNVIPQTDRTYDSVHGLITAGRELATVAALMSQAANAVAEQEAIDVVTKLGLLATAMESAVPHAEAASAALEKVDASVIPEDYQERVVTIMTYGPGLTTALREFVSFSQALSTMLGGSGAMRYLAAFQNTTELRPTGGFIGSFAELKVVDGAIAEMRVPGGGSYDVQGQLTKFVAAPVPLSLINARWEMQDANWFPDFPSSAKKLQWFYENAGGPTTDGVVAVNSTFVVSLLALLGPVDMPEYGRTIDAENFMFEAQKIVELEYDKEENAPKAFIGDLAPILLERVTEADLATFLAVLDLVGRSLEQRDIQVYFRDNTLQAAVEELGWSGSLRQTSGDYLMVVNTNVGGGKTDAVIEQQVDVEVVVEEDGSVINTVTVTKTHRGMVNALFSGRNNVDYLRLYVPEGSELLSAGGFEAPDASLFEISSLTLAVDQDLAMSMTEVSEDAVTGTDMWTEKGKTVFGNWMQTAPGETEVVTFTYRLPFQIAQQETGLLAQAKSRLGMGTLGAYTLFVQKQAGVTTRQTHVAVRLPETMHKVWASLPNIVGDGVTDDNTTDAMYRLLVERE